MSNNKNIIYNKCKYIKKIKNYKFLDKYICVNPCGTILSK